LTGLVPFYTCYRYFTRGLLFGPTCMSVIAAACLCCSTRNWRPGW